MKKYILGFFTVAIALILMEVPGQIVRDLAKKSIASKEDIEIKNIADQYAEASKRFTSSITKFAKADQEIKSSVEQVKRLKMLLLDSQDAVEHHEQIRAKGFNYLVSNKNVFQNEFYEDMIFAFGLEHVTASNQAFLEFSTKYSQLIDYLINNFDKIVASSEPETSHYNRQENQCEIMRKKYNESYIAKMDALKGKYGDSDFNSMVKKLTK